MGRRDTARLSDLKIRRAKATSRDLWLADGGNLYLRVSVNGAKTWTVRRRLSPSKVQVLKLGSYPAMSLSDARKALDGTDLDGDHLKHTVGDLLDDFFERRIRERYRRPRQVLLYVERLKSDYPELARMKLRDVKLAHVSAALVDYAKASPIGANRLAAIVKQAFRYAITRGWLPVSPVAELDRASVGGEEEARERVLTDAELRDLWALEHQHADLLRFLLVTGQRIGEAQRATWAHFDLEGKRWTIPAEHSKNKREHWVALSELAIAILERQDRKATLPFRSASPTAVQAFVRRRQKGPDPWTPHDLRRTFSTRLNELGVAPHVVERMTNHTLPGVMAIYNRAEYATERAAAAVTWDAELRRITA